MDRPSTVTLAAHARKNARRLTASEALRRVLELGASSEDDSDFSEDGDLPLSTALSDEEPLSPPGSPARARASPSPSGYTLSLECTASSIFSGYIP